MGVVGNATGNPAQKAKPDLSDPAAMPVANPELASELLAEPDLAGAVFRFLADLPKRLDIILEKQRYHRFDDLRRHIERLGTTSRLYGYRAVAFLAAKLQSDLLMGEEELLRDHLGELAVLVDRLSKSVSLKVDATTVPTLPDETGSARATVLVIDSDPAVGELIRAYLAKDGIKTIVSDDLWHTIGLIHDHLPDVVLLDADFSPGQATLWYKRFRLDEMSRQIPLICTWTAGREQIEESDPAMRPVEYLPKPFSLSALRVRVNDLAERHRLKEALAVQTGQLYELYNFATELNALMSVESTLAMIGQTAARLTQSQRVSIMLPDPSGQRLRIAWAMGLPDEVLAGESLRMGEGIAGQVFASGRSVLEGSDSSGVFGEDASPGHVVGEPMISLPMNTVEGPVAVLNVSDKVGGAAYAQEDVQILHCIAGAGAVALRTQLQRYYLDLSRDSAVLGLAKLAEHRDPDTGNHLERVVEYCRLLAKAMARQPAYRHVVTSAFIDDLCRSAPLHDIGKVGIPDSILLKPGKLTSEERRIMEAHVEMGGATLDAMVKRSGSGTFLEMAAHIARYHHERYDGKGYLKGLAGEEIPLAARIVSVADVYDALTSNRVYSPARPHKEAADFLVIGAGTQFDPDVVKAFTDQESGFRAVSDAMRSK